ncbi:MAG: TldD/PmbA family protein [Bacteroidaceae bacterium]|nr:TldD/PmbA family protein [Bacteroidaceae bacterium]
MTSPFPFQPEDLRRVLSEALSRGGHYADIFLEDTSIRSLELQDGMVSQAVQTVLYGAGIRVLCGEQTGFAYTMELTMPAMLRAATFAASIGRYGKGGENRQMPLPCLATASKWTRSDEKTENLSPLAVRDILLHIDQMAHEMDRRIVRVKASLNQRLQTVSLVNSLGEEFTDIRPRTTLFVHIVMEQSGQTEMGYASRMMQMGAEMVTETTIREVVSEAVRRAAFLFGASRIEGGETTVVMAAGAGGILLHEAIGHAFEADFIRQGTSVFADMLGKEICSPDITIVDDGTQQGDAGCLAWDDEGTKGLRTVLVADGRLESFMHDRISARHFQVSPTGNGRRQSFRHPPLPRMRSTYMLPGQATADDIIRSVRRGILAEVFTNGQVQIGAGDFTFYMKQGHLIEDGRITRPLRDMNIIGNGPRALRDISLVGNDLQFDHSASMCGKGGQNVPVSQGLPTVLINKLTVG